MYTAKHLGTILDKLNQRKVVKVEFTNGATSFTKDFPFAPTTPVEHVKMRVKAYMEELEAAEAPNNDLAEGDIDLSDVSTTPTQAELDKQAWSNDLYNLEQVQHLIDLGVLTGSEPKVVALRDRVKAGFKPAYINI